MSKKRVETYIPKALEALEECKIVNNGKVKKQFNGYISSFGASVRQAGLLATVLFYRVRGGAEEDRHKVVEALEYILEESLFNRSDKKTRAKVEDAAVALKLCVRTFKLV